MADAQQQVQQFLEYLRSEKNYSKNTIASYRRQLEQVLTACHDWQSMTIHDFREQLAAWNRAGLAPASINQRLCALRGLYNYLVREKLTNNNPLDSISAPKSARRLPKDLSVDSVFYLLDQMPDNDILAIRDRAILELFYSCGLRLSELQGLNLEQLDLPSQQVQVVGKGNKQRQLPIGKQAVLALQAWLSERPSLLKAPITAVFLSTQGKRLSTRSIQARLAYWGKRLGLPSKLHPHKLRHSFASHMLEGSGDLRAVQEMLGHANLTTTQIYTHLDFQHLAKVYDAAHPRAKKK